MSIFSACEDLADALPFGSCYNASQMNTFGQSVKNLLTSPHMKFVPTLTLPEDFLEVGWGSAANIPDPSCHPILYVMQDCGVWMGINDPACDLGSIPAVPTTGTDWIQITPTVFTLTPEAIQSKRVTGATWTTSSTTFAIIDAAAFIQVTPTRTGDVFLYAESSINSVASTSAYSGYLRWRNATSGVNESFVQGGANGNTGNSSSNVKNNAMHMGIFTGLSLGVTYTFELHYATVSPLSFVLADAIMMYAWERG